MATGLTRMVAVGPYGTIYPGSAQDLRTGSALELITSSRTATVRLWADWPTLVPARGQVDPVRLAGLDAQIVAARRAGLGVILSLYRFPGWANGTAALGADALAATMPDRRRADQPDSAAKSLLLRPPDDVDPGSDFAAFVELLVGRYGRLSAARPNPDAWVDWLEVANEPNHMWWPQQGPSATADPFAPGPLSAPGTVARMLRTAAGIAAAAGGEPGIMGPGTADTIASSRLDTPYDVFAESLIGALAALGWLGGPNVAWSMHNYADVTYDQGPGSTAPDAATNPTRSVNRAAANRALLVGRWAGWPDGDPLDARVFLTEGGATLTSIASHWAIPDGGGQRLKQAELLRRSWERMASDDQGAGIVSLANYLLYSDPGYDSGLCEPLEAGGAPRPAYVTWSDLPASA